MEQEALDAPIPANRARSDRRPWSQRTMGGSSSGRSHGTAARPICIIVPCSRTMLLGAVSNALDVQFIPTRLREWWQTGHSRPTLEQPRRRVARAAARRTGAIARSRWRCIPRDRSSARCRCRRAVRRAARARIGSSWPNCRRSSKRSRRALREARAEMDVVAALAPSGSHDADVLATRRERSRGATRGERRGTRRDPARPASAARRAQAIWRRSRRCSTRRD